MPSRIIATKIEIAAVSKWPLMAETIA